MSLLRKESSENNKSQRIDCAARRLLNGFIWSDSAGKRACLRKGLGDICIGLSKYYRCLYCDN
jgi:hypothetical protein